MKKILAFTILIFSVSLVMNAQNLEVKVMSSNIRMATTSDGINYWENRKEWYTDFVSFTDIDVFGAQEVLYTQLQDIAMTLPNYAYVGEGREGGTKGEYSPVFYKKERFKLLDSGTFWLAQHPNQVGNKGWDAALPRIVTWAKLSDKKTGKSFYFFNTHFDHIGKEARYQSAKLILEKTKEIAGDLPFFLSGDLNTTPADLPYKELTKEKDYLKDSKLMANKSYGPENTFNGFQYDSKIEMDRIDYIFYKGAIQILSYQVIDAQRGKLFMSDHFPVVVKAVIEF